jgi:hypothetical protein
VDSTFPAILHIATPTWALAHNPGSTAVTADGVISAGMQFNPGSDDDEGDNDIEIDLVSSDDDEVPTNEPHVYDI